MSINNPLRVLILGCGNMGASHAMAFEKMDGAEICGMSSQNNVSEILNSNTKSYLVYQAENDDFECRIGVNQRIVMVCSVIFMKAHKLLHLQDLKERKNIYRNKIIIN